MSKTCLLLGATGLVGSHCLQLLCNDPTYEKITVLVRRKFTFEHEKVNVVVINFDQMDDYESYFNVDDVFCCLGTTMKKAKTKSNFRKVDFYYPLNAATLAKKMGAKQFLLVSAYGAKVNSPFFYNEVKGRLEEAVSELPINSIHMIKPSLLVGNRNEFRLAEQLGIWFRPIYTPLLRGKFANFRPIEASIVAEAMLKIANSNVHGLYYYTPKELRTLSKEYTNEVETDVL